MSLIKEISIKWHAEDIQWCAKSFSNSKEDVLTPQECSDVLSVLKDKHDATIGINWNVIEYYISEVFKKRKSQRS